MLVVYVLACVAAVAINIFFPFLWKWKRYIARLHHERLEEHPEAEPILVGWPHRKRAASAIESRQTVDGLEMTDSAGVATGDVRITVHEQETEFGSDPKEFAKDVPPPARPYAAALATYDVPPSRPQLTYENVPPRRPAIDTYDVPPPARPYAAAMATYDVPPSRPQVTNDVPPMRPPRRQAQNTTSKVYITKAMKASAEADIAALDKFLDSCQEEAGVSSVPKSVTPPADLATSAEVDMAPVGQLRPASELQARQTVDTDEYAPMAPVERPMVDSGDDKVMARGALRNAPAKVTPVDDDYAPMAPVGQLIASEPLAQEAVDAVVYEAMAPGGALHNAPTKSTTDDDYAPMAPVGRLGPAQTTSDYEDMAPIREQLKAIASRKDLQAVAPCKRLQVANDYEVMAPCKQEIFAKVTPVDDDYAPMAQVGQLIASEPQTQEAVDAGVYEAMAPGGALRNTHAKMAPHEDDYAPMAPVRERLKAITLRKDLQAVAPCERLQVADDYEVMAPRRRKIFDQKAPVDSSTSVPRIKQEVTEDYEVMAPQPDEKLPEKKADVKKSPLPPPRPPKPLPSWPWQAPDTDVYEEMTKLKPIYENAEAMDTIYVNVEEPQRPPARPPKPLPPLPPWRAPDTDIYEAMSLQPDEKLPEKKAEPTYINEDIKEPVYALYGPATLPSVHKPRKETLMPSSDGFPAKQAAGVAEKADQKKRSVTFAPNAAKKGDIEKISRKEESGLLGRLRSLTRKVEEPPAHELTIVHSTMDEAAGRSKNGGYESEAVKVGDMEKITRKEKSGLLGRFRSLTRRVEEPPAHELTIVHSTMDKAAGCSKDGAFESEAKVDDMEKISRKEESGFLGRLRGLTRRVVRLRLFIQQWKRQQRVRKLGRVRPCRIVDVKENCHRHRPRSPSCLGEELPDEKANCLRHRAPSLSCLE